MLKVFQNVILPAGRLISAQFQHKQGLKVFSKNLKLAGKSSSLIYSLIHSFVSLADRTIKNHDGHKVICLLLIFLLPLLDAPTLMGCAYD